MWYSPDLVLRMSGTAAGVLHDAKKLDIGKLQPLRMRTSFVVPKSRLTGKCRRQGVRDACSSDGSDKRRDDSHFAYRCYALCRHRADLL